MTRQHHKNISRPPPEKSPGMIFVSQGACKREKSFRILARGLQTRKILPGVSQGACKREKSFRESRKGLANEKKTSGSLARGLQTRKILLGVSQGACKREKTFRGSRKWLAREKNPFGRLASGLQERTAKLSLYYRCVLIINQFSMNYLCLLLFLFGIFASNPLKRSSLRFGGLEAKSARK